MFWPERKTKQGRCSHISFQTFLHPLEKGPVSVLLPLNPYVIAPLKKRLHSQHVREAGLGFMVAAGGGCGRGIDKGLTKQSSGCKRTGVNEPNSECPWLVDIP